MGVQLDSQLLSSQEAHNQEIEKAFRWRDGQARDLRQQAAQSQTKVEDLERMVLDLRDRVLAFQVRDFAPVTAMLEALRERSLACKERLTAPHNLLNDLDKIADLSMQVRALQNDQAEIHSSLEAQLSAFSGDMSTATKTIDEKFSLLRSDLSDTFADLQKRVYALQDDAPKFAVMRKELNGKLTAEQLQPLLLRVLPPVLEPTLTTLSSTMASQITRAVMQQVDSRLEAVEQGEHPFPADSDTEWVEG